MSVKSNVGKIFKNILVKHFLQTHAFYKLFNRYTVKISYSCMKALVVLSHQIIVKFFIPLKQIIDLHAEVKLIVQITNALPQN